MAADISIEQAPPGLVVNDVVRLSNGLRARVTRVTDTKIRIDANPPLAGKTLQIEMSCRTRSPASSLSQATFAAGCFWGLELALQRVLGVAYTAVGYTQGDAVHSYHSYQCKLFLCSFVIKKVNWHHQAMSRFALGVQDTQKL